MAKNDKSEAAPPAQRYVVVNRPGLKTCGVYKAGVIYAVDSDTAERLIAVKGFAETDRTAFDAQEK